MTAAHPSADSPANRTAGIAVAASFTSRGTAENAEIAVAEIVKWTRTGAKRPPTAGISAPSVAGRPPNGQPPASEMTGGLACRERPL